MNGDLRPPAARCGEPTRTGQPCRSSVDEGERCAGHGGRGRTPAPDPYLPGKPPCARGCGRGARAEVGGEPLCTQHARAAERKAAEDAAFWKGEFTPTPDQPYRADPAWQAARRVMLNDFPDESAGDMTPLRIDAIYRIRDIEAAYERASIGPSAMEKFGISTGS